MASIRNITSEDTGVKMTIGFEWNNDQQTDAWVLFEAEFPRDFKEINVDEQEPAFLELAMAVARGQGVPV